jgi:hypothetical protein
LSALLEFESGINNNNNNNNEPSEEQSQSNGGIIQDVGDIIESLDDLSIDINKKDGKVMKDKKSIQKTPDSFDSSLTLLTSIKAKKKEREGIKDLIFVMIFKNDLCKLYISLM